MTKDGKRFWRASLALVGLAILPPQAGAQPFLYKNNDLLLGFRKTGTFQENYEAVVNIGPATNYVYAPDGATFDVPGFTPTQLVPDCFSSLNNLNWAVCGFARTNLNFVLPGYINNTLWLTVPRTTDNVRAAAPSRLAFPSQGSISVPINSIGRNAVVLSGQTQADQDNTPTFVREPINSPNNYSAYMAAVADSTGSTLNDTWTQSNLEVKTPASFSASVFLDLYQISPIADSGGNPVVDPNAQSADDPAYYVGYFELKPDGTMTFTRASASPPTGAGPPLITLTPTSQTVNAGANVTFTVQASGDQPLFYQWRRNLADIPAATNSTLTLNPVSIIDSGTYFVTVSNAVGTVTSQGALLTVNPAPPPGTGPPVITLQPTNQTVNVGSNVTFTVQASGAPPLLYQWRKGLADIPGATNSTLTLDAVAVTNAGTYFATVLNAEGAASSQGAVLTVNQPPTGPPLITLSPINQTVFAGINVTFTVRASGAPPLFYQWAKGSADIPGATNNTLTINAVAVPDSGTYFVTVTNEVGTVTSLGAVLTVIPLPQIFIDDVQVFEGFSGLTPAVLNVRLTTNSTRVVQVGWATADNAPLGEEGSAAANKDYVPAAGTLIFQPGQTNKTIALQIKGNALYEPNKGLFVSLTNAVNGVLGKSQGVVLISNDDSIPQISVNNTIATFDRFSSAEAISTVAVYGFTTLPITFDWTTSDGTAVAPKDYEPAQGSITIPPVVGSASITITNIVYRSEGDTNIVWFQVNLTNVTGASLTPGGGTVSIASGSSTPPFPALLILDSQIYEGNAGLTPIATTVRLIGSSTETVSVNWRTVDESARALQDYIPAAGRLVFAPGQTELWITNSVIADTLYDTRKTFGIALTNAVNCWPIRPQAEMTIINDDLYPTAGITDVAVRNSGDGVITAVQAVVLSGGNRQAIRIDWTTADDTATAGSDYLSNSGHLIFQPGQSVQTITNIVKRKPVAEIQRQFFVILSSPSNVTLEKSRGTITILDTAPEPVVSVRDASAREGNSGETEVVSEIDLSAPSFLTVTVAWATEDRTALANIDYLPQAGLLTFPPGETRLTLTNLLTTDVIHEPEKAFSLRLLLADNATIGRSDGVVQIQDDDPIPSLSIGGISQRTDETTNVVVPVTLSALTSDPVSVFWFTFDGTAKSGLDYEAQSGLLVFEPLSTKQSVSVRLKASNARFGTNDFFINLANPTNAVVAVATAKVELISPALASAAKPLVITMQRTSAGAAVSFPSQAGASYYLRATNCAGLVNSPELWPRISEKLAGTAMPLTVIDPSGRAEHFYVVEEVP